MTTLEQLFSLRYKVALVSGGAGYLGTEICLALAELGANVILASRHVESCRKKANDIKRMINKPVQVEALVLDVTRPDSVAGCFQQLVAQFGSLDILVNNAWSGEKSTIETATGPAWAYDLEVCLTGVFRCVQQALPELKKTKGVIVNVASMYGHLAPDYRLYSNPGQANPPGYGCAKAGVIQLTRYLASFLAPHGIRANCISPGPFPHPTTRKDDAFMARLASKAPLGRVGQPHEIRGVIALLCSDASSYMTGQNICVDGGWSIW